MFGGGDSAAVNMREAIAGQILLYPESRVPFDTPAAVEHNSRSHCLYGITVIALVLYSSPMIRRTAFVFLAQSLYSSMLTWIVQSHAVWIAFSKVLPLPKCSWR